ncbi:DNA-processing protein DprA [[Clostridium] polysaccharolyticum]|uniref:DNA processing protein n=1 Tax=[Clostridium] polysaccharolyticum TaxID=29364 RepID=A0A1H9Y1E2_9FIRM|nr:DNA-processing protein DprA [[Clostridium] polysaccharolyticum]SES62614.1 DNA processing protein [[Clostridium] polysaccharolyticum]
MTRNELWFWLSNASGIGLKKIEYLLGHFQQIEAIYEASSKELCAVKGISEKDALALKREKEDYKRKYQRMKKLGIEFVAKEDKKYPKKLHNLLDSPYGIYVRGNNPDEEKKSIAIIGARDCSVYGKEMAIWFAKELSLSGIQIISGMARGIDGYAHTGVLTHGKEEGAATFAVLGSGIDVCYPKEHYWMYRRMQEEGGIISEYGLGVAAKPGQFPMRNRLISGLSDGILIIEAKERSGSLITADLGLEQGKDIFSVPGRIGDDLSFGCNNLIKMGAFLVQSPKDILQHYHFSIVPQGKVQKKSNYMLETKEKIVYANLSYNPKHINELIVDTKFCLSELMEILVALELKGYIRQAMKNFYIVCSD